MAVRETEFLLRAGIPRCAPLNLGTRGENRERLFEPIVKLPYREGTIFLVPIAEFQYSVGLVGRVAKRGSVLMAYFFGPTALDADQLSYSGITPAAAILKLRCGDLKLLNGEWAIVGQFQNWDRSLWPIPDFVTKDPIGRRPPIRVRYDPDDPSKRLADVVLKEPCDLPPNLFSGAAAIEAKLRNLLL